MMDEYIQKLTPLVNKAKLNRESSQLLDEIIDATKIENRKERKKACRLWTFKEWKIYGTI